MARTKKVEVVTEAKPHTIKKFELIEKYVEAWAYKILNYHGNPKYAPASGVIFIDCMSNLLEQDIRYSGRLSAYGEPPFLAFRHCLRRFSKNFQKNA